MRIRSESGQCDDPKDEHFNKWFCRVSLWSVDGEEEIGTLGMWGPFETQKMAQARGKEVGKFAAEEIEKLLDGKASGKYLDMKNGGVLRSWQEH